MKTVLCFGDSNTWGWNPLTCERYPFESRWTSVLAAALAEEWMVIPEGLNGRTSVLDDPVEGDKNGKKHLPPCLESHKPIDLVILALGTNDLKFRFHFSAFDVAQGVGSLVDLVRASGTGNAGGVPEILVLAPAPIEELSDYKQMFQGGRATSLGLKAEFAKMALQREVSVLDVGGLVSSSPDGIHLSAEGHRALGLAVAQTLKRGRDSASAKPS